MPFSSNYFSLQDILSTQERIPFKTKVDLPQLGFLDPSSFHPQDPMLLPANVSLELPFWMVWALKGRGRIDAEIPKQFKASQRQIVAADPTVVNLHAMGPFYYEAGRHLVRLIQNHPESEHVSNLLVEALTKRFRNIMDASLNADSRDALCNTEGLDETERDLYLKGQQAMKNQNVWLRRKTDVMTASEVVVKHRKRKAEHIS